MRHEVHIHKAYAEWEEAKEEGHKFTQMMGKYHHTFWSKRGKISMVRIKNYMKKGDDFWEIYCLKGKLFEDVERFKKRGDAIKRIEELLREKEKRNGKPFLQGLKLFLGIFAIAVTMVASTSIIRTSDSFLLKILCGTLFWIVLLGFMDWRAWVKK